MAREDDFWQSRARSATWTRVESDDSDRWNFYSFELQLWIELMWLSLSLAVWLYEFETELNFEDRTVQSLFVRPQPNQPNLFRYGRLAILGNTNFNFAWQFYRL